MAKITNPELIKAGEETALVQPIPVKKKAG